MFDGLRACCRCGHWGFSMFSSALSRISFAGGWGGSWCFLVGWLFLRVLLLVWVVFRVCCLFGWFFMLAGGLGGSSCLVVVWVLFRVWLLVVVWVVFAGVGGFFVVAGGASCLLAVCVWVIVFAGGLAVFPFGCWFGWFSVFWWFD